MSELPDKAESIERTTGAQPVPEELRQLFTDAERLMAQMRRIDPEGYAAAIRDAHD